MKNGYSPGTVTPTSNIEEDTDKNATEYEILNNEDDEPVPGTALTCSAVELEMVS